MKVIDSVLDDQVLLIQPRVFQDDRGHFFESFSLKEFQGLGKSTKGINFVQDNQSLSDQNVLRGMHFQSPPHQQGKLVRVISGSVYDVALDIRKDSPTFGKAQGFTLSADNFLQLWIPPGFAHGFQTLEINTIFAYKCTEYYQPDSEGGIRWNDSEISIDWPNKKPLISNKDQKMPLWSDFKTPFK